MDKVPELASQVGLKVILGIWLGRDRGKNAQLIDTALSAAEQHRDVVTAPFGRQRSVVAGRNARLRSAKNHPLGQGADTYPGELRRRLGILAALSGTCPTTSTSSRFTSCPIGKTFRFAPKTPQRMSIDIRRQVALAFPGKEILIGEAGWPSKGRMRDGALPSRINQARFISGLLDRARQEKFRVNLFEAYDEPWKRQWEGTVGAHWGLFDGETRALKYPPGIAVSNYPFWKLQLGRWARVQHCVFAVAFWTRGAGSLARSGGVGGGSDIRDDRRRSAGAGAEKMLYESYGCRRLVDAGACCWLRRSPLPLLSANAVMSGRALPTFVELIGPRGAQDPVAAGAWLWAWR